MGGATLPTSPDTSTIMNQSINTIDMKQNSNYRPNGIARRLRRIEDKIDIILSDLNRINARMLTIERQQREDFTDATINRLHAAAQSLKATADKELQAVSERYGTSSI